MKKPKKRIIWKQPMEVWREEVLTAMATEFCRELSNPWMVACRWLHLRVPVLRRFIQKLIRLYNVREIARIKFDITKIPGLVHGIERELPKIYKHFQEHGDTASLAINLKFSEGKEGFECKPTLNLTLSSPGKLSLGPVPVFREDGTIYMEVTVQAQLPFAEVA